LNKDKAKILTARNWACESRHLLEKMNFHPEYNLGKVLRECILWNKEKKWLKE